MFYTPFRGKSNKSKTWEESSHSREVSGFSTIQQEASEGSDLTGGTTEEQEKDNITERLTPKDKLFEGESVNSELNTSGSLEQDHLKIWDSDKEKAINCVDVDHPDSEFSEISLGVLGDVACVSPPTAAEDDTTEEGVLDKNIIDSNERTAAEEQAEVFPHSPVNVFEANFEGKDSAIEGSAATGDRQEEEDKKTQYKDTSLPFSESLKSEYERPERNQRQPEDQAETTEELERLQTCSEEAHDRFSHIEDSKTHKADLRVEVSFEDLPEAQEIKEFEDRQAEGQDAVEVLQTNIEMPPVKESQEIVAAAPDQNVSVTQDHEHEMVGVEMEANSEGKEKKSQQEASVMKDRVDTNDPNLTDENEMGQGDEVVSSLDQPTGTPDSDKPEYDNGHTHERSLKISEGECQQEDPNSEEAKTTDGGNEDEEHVSEKGRCKGGAENQSLQASQSNSSTRAAETATETLETSVPHLSEDDDGGQGTAIKAEPEVTVLEEEPSEPLELEEERPYGTQEDTRTSVKDSASPDPPADEGEKGHSEKDTAGPEDSRGEKVLCMRCFSKEYSQHSWEFNLKHRI